VRSEREPGGPALSVIALAAVAEATGGAAGHAGGDYEAAYLREQLALITGHGHTWQAAFDAARVRPASRDRELWHAAEALGLEPAEILAIALAAAVEDEPMVGRALAYVQAPVGGSRPTVGLLARALAGTGGPGVDPDIGPIHALAGGVGRRTGFLVLAPGGAPLSERVVALPEHVAAALRGFDVPVAEVSLSDDAARIALPDSVIDAARGHAGALQKLPRTGLVVRSTSRLEGRTIAAIVAGAMDRQPAFLHGALPAGLAPWLLLRRRVPVFCVDLAPSEERALPEIEGWSGPILVLCGHEGHVNASAHTLTNFRVPMPGPDERVALWQVGLDERDPERGSLARALGATHRHGAGRIAQLARAMHYRATLADRAAPGLEDAAWAAWSVEGGGLDALAVPVTERVSDDALVLPQMLRSQLEALLMRCRMRDGLNRDLGPALQSRYRPGVCALFVGRSGTGKTLAASWLATRLGLPLYRVDLAGVLSKYIGETEKNLSQVLAQAEHAEVVLLFDEADALFGQRTDVKQANDRFANTQTNYLLQRIEAFDGIAVLTSNSRDRFDGAFTRRLDTILEFQAPAPAERRRLWQAHLGKAHGVSGRDLGRLAACADLCGGHIRNAVLTAVVQARSQGRVVEYRDLLTGLEQEYRKLNRELPTGLASEHALLGLSSQTPTG
jgi:hypothetical protein